MRAPESTFWRDHAARREDSFHDALYRSVRQTPWWLISLGVHLLLAMALFSVGFSSGSASPPGQLASRIDEVPDELISEEIEPVIEELDYIEQPDDVLLPPTLDESKAPEEQAR